jgi:hypothetical protein
MRRMIQQTILLPASPEELFHMYIDPVLHEAITGAPATVSIEPGSAFAAFDGGLTGSTLCAIAPRLIVQSWRSGNFLDADPDSTLILNFSADAGQGRIELVHLDVPDQDFEGVDEGWELYYWAPWRDYLARR